MAEVKSDKKQTKNLHAGHRKRVWQEFMRKGIDENTPPHKVLEFLLFFTIPRKDTNELAHILLNHFNGSFSRVMEASIPELMEVDGIGEYTAVHIKSVLDFVKYYHFSKAKREKVVFTKQSGSNFLFSMLVDAEVEQAYLLCLDNVNRFLACPKISEGDENSVFLSPRKIVEKITQIGATKVILAHNHPRGVALPSREDLHLTSQIAVALSGIKVEFLDHIIVAEKDFTSMKDTEAYREVFNI